jgi:hypothetical protein
VCTQAFEQIQELQPDAVMVNCVNPEVMTAALPFLKATGVPVFGGHANGLGKIPEGWTLATGGYEALGNLVKRD